MTLIDPGAIGKVQGAIQKLTDANDKLCEVYTDPAVSTADKLAIRRSLTGIAQAKMDASGVLPPEPEP